MPDPSPINSSFSPAPMAGLSPPGPFTDAPPPPLLDDNATGIAPEPAPPPSPDGYRTTPDHTTTGWPPGVPFIVGNEACERFSFYGMRAILYIHLVSPLRRPDVGGRRDSRQGLRHGNGPPVHRRRLRPADDRRPHRRPLGGQVSHHLLSSRWSTAPDTPCCRCTRTSCGACTSAWASSPSAPAASSRASAPTSATSSASCNWFRVRTVYQIFYFSINFGSFFATLLIPYLKDNAGPLLIGWFPGTFAGSNPAHLGTSVAFGIPGVLMFMATFLFWLGRRKFVHVPPRSRAAGSACSTPLLRGAVHGRRPSVFHAGTASTRSPATTSSCTGPLFCAISGVFLGLGLYLFPLRQRLAPDDGFLAITLHVVRTHLARLRGERPSLEGNGRGDSSTPGRGRHALARSRFWAPADPTVRARRDRGPGGGVQDHVHLLPGQHLLGAVRPALLDLDRAGRQDGPAPVGRRSTRSLGIPNQTIKASQVPALNPLMVMLLIPLMNVLYNLFDRMGLKTTPLRRVTVGMCSPPSRSSPRRCCSSTSTTRRRIPSGSAGSSSST